MNKGRGIKLGIVGAGVMGQNHARIAASLSGINLVGVFDLDSSRSEGVSRLYKVKSFPSFQQLLAKTDAVCIATPTQTHHQLALETLNSGRHVLVEKPFTGDPEKARELLELAKAKGLILAVGMVERFNPAFTKLLTLLKGEKIHGIDIKRYSPYPERITDTNVIYDMMLHDLHLLLFLVKDEIDSIKAEGKREKSKLLDHVTATICYKNGSIARVEANRLFSIITRNITVTAEKELFEADLLNKRIYIRDFSSPSPSAIPVKSSDQITEELKDFRDAIKGRRLLLSDPIDVIRALKLAKEVESACL